MMTTGKSSINRGESANDDSESDREDLSRTECCPCRTRQAAGKQQLPEPNSKDTKTHVSDEIRPESRLYKRKEKGIVI